MRISRGERGRPFLECDFLPPLFSLQEKCSSRRVCVRVISMCVKSQLSSAATLLLQRRDFQAPTISEGPYLWKLRSHKTGLISTQFKVPLEGGDSNTHSGVQQQLLRSRQKF